MMMFYLHSESWVIDPPLTFGMTFILIDYKTLLALSSPTTDFKIYWENLGFGISLIGSLTADSSTLSFLANFSCYFESSDSIFYFIFILFLIKSKVIIKYDLSFKRYKKSKNYI